MSDVLEYGASCGKCGRDFMFADGADRNKWLDNHDRDHLDFVSYFREFAEPRRDVVAVIAQLDMHVHHDIDSSDIAAVLDAHRRACVITTVEQLEANWPMETVIQELPAHDFDFYPQIWEMAFQCGWTRAGRKFDPDDQTPRLPARLLHHPDWGVKQ